MLYVREQNNLHTMDDALTDSMTSVWFAALLKPSGYHLLPFDAPLLSSIVQTPNHHCVRWSQISKMTLLWICQIQLVVNYIVLHKQKKHGAKDIQGWDTSLRTFRLSYIWYMYYLQLPDMCVG